MSQEITKEWFNKWANEYDEIMPKVPVYQKMTDAMVKDAGVRNGDCVLDIGCGTGFLSLKFLGEAECELFGLDISEEMVAVFRKKLGEIGPRFEERTQIRIGTATDLPFEDESFHIVASSFTLHHLPPEEKSKAVKEIYRILKPKGKLVIGEINLDTTGSLDDVERLYRVMNGLVEELAVLVGALGHKVLYRMFDNAKKHLLNDGEHCISLDMWSAICEESGFVNIKNQTPEDTEIFSYLVCEK
ncbi:MAG: class I SAM-dependent methyltransferase [Desulfobacterales bacterium]|nr:class I SAM-dependent methyltransferase [Desulfobacterales bacterium]